MNKFLSWLTTPRLLVGILFVAIFTMAVRTPLDTDSWWHLRSGQYIVENQALFSADPFSHTQLGQAWLYPKAAQIFLYQIYAQSGQVGLSLALAIMVTAAFVLVWQITPGNLYIRAFALLLGVLASALTWVARPQMVSFFLAALVLVMLEKYKRTGLRLIYGLPLIVIIWVNMHGGYAVAFILVGIYLVGESLNRITKHSADSSLSWRQIGILLGIAIISFLAAALNPHGWQMWLYPFQTVGIGALRDFIQEWQSPNFHATMTWPFVAMFLLTITAIGLAVRYTDWSDLVLVSVWLGWSLFAVRNIGLYGLLTVPVLARYGDAVVGKYLPVPGRARWGKRSKIIYLNWFLLLLVLFAALAQISATLLPLSAAEPEPKDLPVAAVQFIEENNPPGPIFNSYNWGGYLIFKLWPNYPVYIDGRTDLYADAFMRRYLNVMMADDGWEEILAEDGVNLVLVESNSVLARFLKDHSDWQELYRDDIAVIYGAR